MKATLLFLCIFLSFQAARGQGLSGNYFNKSIDGNIQLHLKVDDVGKLTGVFTSYNGMRYRLKGVGMLDMAEGKLTGTSGVTMFFEVKPKGDKLTFSIFPSKPNGEPDFGNSQHFDLEKKSASRKAKRLKELKEGL